MVNIEEAIKFIEDAIDSVFGITYIVRANPYEVGDRVDTPFATIILDEVELTNDSHSQMTSNVTVLCYIMFVSERELVSKMNKLGEFREMFGYMYNVDSVIATRFSNEMQKRQYNYAMEIQITFTD